MILERLEKSKGQYISGEVLATECHVSRNAIWKAVSELRNSGYQIESVNNKGYCLSVDCDIISEEALRRWITTPIYVYKEIDSTNTEAKRLLINSDRAFVHGSLIIALTQSAGRGHSRSRFNSPDGGIYLSIILEPDKMKSGSKNISHYIVKSVAAVLERELGISLIIKDKGRIYQGSRKICGILTEGISDMETGEYSNYIAGIGILTENIKSEKKIDKNKLIASVFKCVLEK